MWTGAPAAAACSAGWGIQVPNSPDGRNFLYQLSGRLLRRCISAASSGFSDSHRNRHGATGGRSYDDAPS